MKSKSRAYNDHYERTLALSDTPMGRQEGDRCSAHYQRRLHCLLMRLCDPADVVGIDTNQIIRTPYPST